MKSHYISTWLFGDHPLPSKVGNQKGEEELRTTFLVFKSHMESQTDCTCGSNSSQGFAYLNMQSLKFKSRKETGKQLLITTIEKREHGPRKYGPEGTENQKGGEIHSKPLMFLEFLLVVV